MKKIVGLILCCLMIIPLVGCSSKSDTPKATVKTPIQLANDRINASDAINSRQDTNITDLSNRITAVEVRPQTDLSPLTARVSVLETLNMSTFAGDLSFLTVRVSSLESYNISTRIAALENMSHDITAIIGSYNISQLITIYHNLLNMSTWANISVPSGCITKPNVINPQNGNMSEPNTSVRLEWNFQPNASGYEVYLGTNTDSASMAFKVSTASQMYYQTVLPNTVYFWKVIAISSCGNKSSETWWFKTQ